MPPRPTIVRSSRCLGMAFRSRSQFRFEASKTAEETGRPVCGCRANDQAARDRLNRASSDSQASISLRIADNRGSVAVARPTVWLFRPRSRPSAFRSFWSITASLYGGGGTHGIQVTDHAGGNVVGEPASEDLALVQKRAGNWAGWRPLRGSSATPRSGRPDDGRVTKERAARKPHGRSPPSAE
jgi:hypothetical protein